MFAKTTKIAIAASTFIGLSVVGAHAQSFGDRSFTRLNYNTDFVHVQPNIPRTSENAPLFVLGDDGRLEYIDSSEVSRRDRAENGTIRSVIGNILRF